VIYGQEVRLDLNFLLLFLFRPCCFVLTLLYINIRTAKLLPVSFFFFKKEYMNFKPTPFCMPHI
jgi:hypothetical protein